MKNQEIIKLALTLFQFSEDGVEEVKTSKQECDTYGDNEIGYYKQVSENKFILCNERVDSSVILNPVDGVKAIRLSHYHRRGLKYGITLYV